MTDGLRDSFIENDAIGFTNTGTTPLVGFSSRSNRKKVKRRRKSVRHIRRKHRVRRAKKNNRTRKFYRKSRGGIKYTKKGQPYKIMPNGRARFIKK